MKYLFLESNKVLGKNLTYYIDKTGISREKLAKVSVVSRSYISEIEKGKKDPKFSILSKLATAMGISTGELCDNSKYTDGNNVADLDVKYIKSNPKSKIDNEGLNNKGEE